MSGLANVVTASLTPELDRLTVDIRDEHKAAQRDHLSAVKHAIRCGQLLLEAKAGVSHGAWHIGSPTTSSSRIAPPRGTCASLASTPRKRNALRI